MGTPLLNTSQVFKRGIPKIYLNGRYRERFRAAQLFCSIHGGILKSIITMIILGKMIVLSAVWRCESIQNHSQRR